MNTQKQDFVSNKEVLGFILFSALLVAFLFYIDEGNYSFEWALRPDHIPIFLIYLIVALAGQVITARIFWLFDKGVLKTLVSTFVGPFVSVAILIVFFYAIR